MMFWWLSVWQCARSSDRSAKVNVQYTQLMFVILSNCFWKLFTLPEVFDDDEDLSAGASADADRFSLPAVVESLDPCSVSLRVLRALVLFSSLPFDVFVSLPSPPESDSFSLDWCSRDSLESTLLSSPLLSPLDCVWLPGVPRKLLSIWLNCLVYRSGGRLLIMRFSSFVSIWSYSSLMDESDEMVDVGVDSGDDDGLSVVAVGCDVCSTPLKAGVGDELADAIFRTIFRRSRYRLMSWWELWLSDHSCRMLSASTNFLCLNKEWINRFLTFDSVVPVVLFGVEELDVDEDDDEADDGVGLAESVARSVPFSSFSKRWQSSVTTSYCFSSKQHSVLP